MISSGIALIAAESTVIANPAWIQTMTTISMKVFSGALMQEVLGLEAERLEDGVEQADLRA